MKYLEKMKLTDKKIMKNSLKTLNQYQKHSKGLKVEGVITLLKKLISLI